MTTLRIHQGRMEVLGAHTEDMGNLIAFRDQWEERAGILEHQGGLSREEAELRAFADCALYSRAKLHPIKPPQMSNSPWSFNMS